MEIGDRTRIVRFDHHHEAANGRKHRKSSHGAGDAGAKIAERQPLCSGIIARRSFQHGVDRGTKIGTQDKREGGVGRDHSLGSQRHNEQNDGDAGMRRPSQASRKEDIEKWRRRNRAEQHPQTWLLLIGGHQIEELAQSEQHQSKPGEYAAEIAGLRARIAAEHKNAYEYEGGRNGGNLERQNLHNERGADIGSQHHRKRGHEIDKSARRKSSRHEAGCRAALEQGRNAYPGEKSPKAVAQRAAKD